MTTIATDGRTMAADTMVNAGGYFVGSHAKIVRTLAGGIAGGCGSTIDNVLFSRFMEQGGDRPTLSDRFHGLILNADGSVDWIDERWEPIRYELPAAIGSGDGYALGAMLAGASPERAVAIAAERDLHTGREIVVLGLETVG